MSTAPDRLYHYGGVPVDAAIDVRAYGAKGDGTTDDTSAIQDAIDALDEGECLIFPEGTYKTKTLFINTSNVKLFGVGPNVTLSISESYGHGLMVHGGTMATRSLAYYGDTYAVTDYNGTRISGVQVENIKIDSFSGAAINTSIGLEWADDCKVTNCTVEDSDGNSFDVRFCKNTIVRRCISTSPAAYGIFVWMSDNALIESCQFTEGTQGVSLKHRYNDVPCRHVIRGNLFSSNGNPCINGGFNYEAAPAEDYYIGTFETVEEVTVENNQFNSVSTDTYAPIIGIGSYAARWTIRNNTWDGGGITSGNFPLSIGSVGDWHSNGNLGTTGQDHVIEGNTFSDMILGRIADVGASCRLLNNNINCKTKLFARESSARLNDALVVDVSKNRMTLLDLSASGESGLARFDTNTRILTACENSVEVTPAQAAANAVAQGIFSAAAVSVINDNNIKIVQGHANHTSTYAIIVNGASAVVKNNLLAVNGSAVKQGINVGSSATDDTHVVTSNVIENLGNTTGATAISLSARTDCTFNQLIGTWNTTISDAGGHGHSLGTRRIVWATTAPAAGAWVAGDVCFDIVPVSGAQTGWQCTVSGTPGTWVAMANLA